MQHLGSSLVRALTLVLVALVLLPRASACPGRRVDPSNPDYPWPGMLSWGWPPPKDHWWWHCDWPHVWWGHWPCCMIATPLENCEWCYFYVASDGMTLARHVACDQAAARACSGTLSIGSKMIKTLSPNALAGLSNVTSVYLNDNDIEQLLPGVFQNFTSVRGLYLDSNKIETLPADLFAGSPSLRYLHLSNNRISSVPEDVLRGLTSLQVLNISYNNIRELPERMFEGLTSLRYIYVGGNQLRCIPQSLPLGVHVLGTEMGQYLRLPRCRGNTTAEPTLSDVLSTRLERFSFPECSEERTWEQISTDYKDAPYGRLGFYGR
jgi:hypothetical protein